MKKILLGAALIAAGASFAADSTQFGILKVPSSAKTTIVSVPWLESSTGTSSVTVSNLVLTSGLSDGDTLSLYENGAYTKSWRLNGGVWEGATVANADSQSDSGSDQTTIDRGKAIMLTRADPGDCFYIMGKPADASTTEMALPTASAEGATWALVAPPSVTNVAANALTWTNLKAGLDVVHVPNVSSGVISTYTWTGKRFRDSKGNEPTISAGTGVWFVTTDKETSGKKVAW